MSPPSASTLVEVNNPEMQLKIRLEALPEAWVEQVDHIPPWEEDQGPTFRYSTGWLPVHRSPLTLHNHNKGILGTLFFSSFL